MRPPQRVIEYFGLGDTYGNDDDGGFYIVEQLETLYENVDLEGGDADRVTTFIIKHRDHPEMYRIKSTYNSWGDGGIQGPDLVEKYPVVMKMWLTEDEADALGDRVLPPEEY
jgi:hypothetical protein